jgi:hypothetical protein
VVEEDLLIDLARIPTPSAAIERLAEGDPLLTAIDRPISVALDGERSRRCVRAFVRERICQLRYTPDAASLRSNPSYYEWIVHGQELTTDARRMTRASFISDHRCTHRLEATQVRPSRASELVDSTKTATTG